MSALLCLCRFEIAVFGHGGAVKRLQMIVKDFTLLAHGIMKSSREFIKWWNIYESSHSKGLRASQRHKRQAMSGSRLESASTSQIDDHTFFGSQDLRFVNGHSKTCHQRELRPGAVRFLGKLIHSQNGHKLLALFTWIESRTRVVSNIDDNGFGKCAQSSA